MPTANKLPPHLAQAIGRAFAKDDLPYVVAQLEACGVQVMVRRLQLGDQRSEGYGQTRIIYQSPQREEADVDAGNQ